jgi:SAM-dependent methyltransferase
MMDADGTDWLSTPLGRAVVEVERGVLQDALGDVFGFELLQIGAWGDALQVGEYVRTQHRRSIAPEASGTGAIRARYDALPIATSSVEAVLLAHTLEHAPNPHELLREVERILVGDGHLLVCGFSPFGPWGLRHLLSRRHFPPALDRMLSEGRIRDWMRLLGFEVVETRRYLFAPPWTHRRASGSPSWLERRGPDLLPPLAGAYFVKARKRVRVLTPLRPVWHRTPAVVGGIAEPTSRNAA